MKNIPETRMAIVAVSRDCFPKALSIGRREAVVKQCAEKSIEIIEIERVIENELDATAVLKELQEKKVNSLVLYLGNFGPEGPTTIVAQQFEGPVMLVAAAEESGDNLIGGRGDAYCGMLNASYNCGLRKVKAYIPEYPVGTPVEVASMIGDFCPIARTINGLKGLKVFTFGPRPQDFLACNAPIKPLFDLGIEVMENSELDLYDIYKSAEGAPEITGIAQSMAEELGKGNTYPDLLNKLAQFELALLRFFQENIGASQYGIFANKCWPSFEKFFGFTPCYVNARLAGQGIPVSCEVDIYGAVSEYMATCATEKPATLLDINNTVPQDMFEKNATVAKEYTLTDLFMGFHCGNTNSACMKGGALKYQLIMHRLMEPGKDPDITRGTYEGVIKDGPITLFRLQSTADTQLRSYLAEGEVLNIDPKSFGSIGVFAIKEMGRFYRHVLIEGKFPHHAAIAFGHAAKSLFESLKLCDVPWIGVNQPKNTLYKTENPFG